MKTPPDHAQPCPLAAFDDEYRRQWGVELIGGVDEAGRGPWAGPVVASCVVLRPGAGLPGLNDSKQLTPKKREALLPQILDAAAGWGAGWATAAEIDTINVLRATHLAAQRAMGRLAAQPGGLLTDYLKLDYFFGAAPVEPLKKGDARSQAIAAASVLAKVARDRVMMALDALYPVYGFAKHKGYGGSRAHGEALEAHGSSTLHRLSFRPLCERWPRPAVRAIWPHARPAPGGAEPDWAQILAAQPSEWDAALIGSLLPEAERA